MSLRIEFRFPPCSVGRNDEDGCAPTGIAVLETHVEWMRFCEICDSEQVFVAGWQCATGLVGCCLGCGNERVAPFTRTTSEVA
jgi:hypothetical protein